jgi:polyisoprenoid-binding protein YceI
MAHHRWTLAILSSGMAVAIVAGAPENSYRIDSARSTATIDVGKSGLLSFAGGHTHQVVASGISGTIALDVDDPSSSAVHVTIDASALKVSGKGEPPDDVPKVQETMMGPQVLDVQQYPAIAFESTGITMKDPKGDALNASQGN